MPFNFLLWRCLAPGKTSYQEPRTGWGVRVQPINDETILFLLTDADPVREYFSKKRKWYDLKNVADLLVYCKRKNSSPILLFVELKGSDIDQSVEQLCQTIEAIKAVLPTKRMSLSV